jgi:hypothetical protein
MSANPIYDDIEDTIVGELEREGSKLPSSFTVTLEPLQMMAFLHAGLMTKAGEKRLPVTTTSVLVRIAGCDILIQSEDHVESEAQ